MAVETRAPTFIAVGVLMIVLCTASVILRITSRYLSRAGISWDDWICVACLPMIIATHALVMETTNHGLGYHDVDAPNNAVPYFQRTIYIVEFFYTISLALVKISVLLFYRRVFRSVSPIFKIVLWSTGGITAAWCIAVVFLGAFQCTPVEAAWNPLLHGKCIDQRIFFLAQAIPNLVLDFVVLVIPMPFLIKLQVANSQRIGLVVVFVLGYFVPIISIVRMTSIVQALSLVAAFQADPHSVDLDITWNYVNVALWTIVEPSLGLFSCCIPGFQYLFTAALKRYVGLTTSDGSTRKRRIYDNTGAYAKQAVSNHGSSFSRLRDDETAAVNTYALGDLDKRHQTMVQHVHVGPNSGKFMRVPSNAIYRQDDVTIHEGTAGKYR